jgi:hypothetical protein
VRPFRPWGCLLGGGADGEHPGVAASWVEGEHETGEPGVGSHDGLAAPDRAVDVVELDRQRVDDRLGRIDQAAQPGAVLVVDEADRAVQAVGA